MFTDRGANLRLRRADVPARLLDGRDGAAPDRVHVLRAAAARGGAVAARPGPGPGAGRHHRPGFGRLPGPDGARPRSCAGPKAPRSASPTVTRPPCSPARPSRLAMAARLTRLLRRRGGQSSAPRAACWLCTRPGPGPDRRAPRARHRHHRRGRRLLRRLHEPMAGRCPGHPQRSPGPLRTHPSRIRPSRTDLSRNPALADRPVADPALADLTAAAEFAVQVAATVVTRFGARPV